MIVVIEDGTILGELSKEGLAAWQRGEPIPKNQTRKIACNVCMTILSGQEECDKCHNVTWLHPWRTHFGEYPNQGDVCLPCYQIGQSIFSFAQALSKPR